MFHLRLRNTKHLQYKLKIKKELLDSVKK